QERMPAGLAQEELERVSRRLDWGREDGGSRLALVLEQLVAARFELAEDEIGLDWVEAVDVEQLPELRRSDRALRPRCLQELHEILALEEGLEIDCRLVRPLSGGHPRLSVASALWTPLSTS